MYTINKIGHKTKPCGKPKFIFLNQIKYHKTQYIDIYLIYIYTYIYYYYYYYQI